MISPGENFDRYRIEALLGEGGMGRVFAAYDERLRRRVALKVLRVERAGAADRLLREARAAAALSHPNVVAIHDVGERDGVPYIVMELVEGRRLRDFVADGLTPLADRVRWLVDVARALAAAHARGLVHRDVKPENVMVCADGVIKVLDFGIARRVNAEERAGDAPPPSDAADTATAEGRVVGTPRFMSPEQVAGAKVDARSDQFSWAVVAYELLAGAHPWDTVKRDDGEPIADLVLRASPKPLGEVAPEVSAEVQAVVAKALAKEPHRRFESMDDIVRALAPHVGATVPLAQASRDAKPIAETLDRTARETAEPANTTVATVAGSRPPTRARRATGIFAFVLVAAAGVAAVGLARSRAVATASSAATALSSSPARKTSVMELAPPKSANAEAVTAYVTAQQAFHDGNMSVMMREYERAVSLDPSLAEAQLRLALHKLLRQPVEARAAFQRAVALRAALSPHDQALLDASRLYVLDEPPRPNEWATRCEEALTPFPDDAEILYFVGTAHTAAGNRERAIAAYERAVAVDPTFARALDEIAQQRLYLEDFEVANAMFDRCLEVSPSATACLLDRTALRIFEGRCEELGNDARRMIAIDPTNASAYSWLAESQIAAGKPLEAVRESIRQRIRLTPDTERAAMEATWRMRFAAITGDFEAAVRALEQRLVMVSQQSESLRYAEHVFDAVPILEEMGRNADALAIASSYVAKRDAWVADPKLMTRAMAQDPLLGALALQVRAHAMKREAFEDERARWIADWEKRRPAARPVLWIYAYAEPARTRAEAEEAMGALARFAPLPKYPPFTVRSAFATGRTYALVERHAEALPYLRRATRACWQANAPVETTRAYAAYGESLDATGDRDGACAAYAIVLARWGAAKPSSVTATRVGARARALKCDARPPVAP